MRYENSFLDFSFIGIVEIISKYSHQIIIILKGRRFILNRESKFLPQHVEMENNDMENIIAKHFFIAKRTPLCYSKF